MLTSWRGITCGVGGGGGDAGKKKSVPNSNYVVPMDKFSSSSSITRPLIEILCDLNKKIPDNIVKSHDPGYIAASSGFIPWFHANRMLSFYAPGWCEEVRDVIFSENGNVTVVYRLTICGSDGEIKLHYISIKKTSCNRLRLTDLMEKWRKCKKGHFAVYTREGRRFVLPLDYLKHPIFQVLLEMAEEEFGSTICGPLQVPCDGGLMDHILMLLRKRSLSGHGDENGDDDVKKKSHLVSSMSMSCKGASSVSYFFPLFLCNAAPEQTKLQSLVF